MVANNYNLFLEKNLVELFPFVKTQVKEYEKYSYIQVGRASFLNQKKMLHSKQELLNRIYKTFKSTNIIGDKDDLGFESDNNLIQQTSTNTFQILRKIELSEYKEMFYMGNWAASPDEISNDIEDLFGLADNNDSSVSNFIDSGNNLILLSGHDDDDWTFIVKK